MGKLISNTSGSWFVILHLWLIDFILSFIHKLIFTTTHALTYWEWPTYLTINLERTKYSYSMPVLLWVLAMEVFNPDSISSESEVSCEKYGLLGGIWWNPRLCIPIHIHTPAFRMLSIKWSPVKILTCIASHLYVDSLLSFFFRRGRDPVALSESFFSSSDVVRCGCKFIYVATRCIFAYISYSSKDNFTSLFFFLSSTY